MGVCFAVEEWCKLGEFQSESKGTSNTVPATGISTTMQNCNDNSNNGISEVTSNAEREKCIDNEDLDGSDANKNEHEAESSIDETAVCKNDVEDIGRSRGKFADSYGPLSGM